jgi:hypothetical protein
MPSWWPLLCPVYSECPTEYTVHVIGFSSLSQYNYLVHVIPQQLSHYHMLSCMHYNTYMIQLCKTEKVSWPRFSLSLLYASLQHYGVREIMCRQYLVSYGSGGQ